MLILISIILGFLLVSIFAWAVHKFFSSMDYTLEDHVYERREKEKSDDVEQH